MSVANVILSQIDHTRPDDVIPGKDVGVAGVGSDSVILVWPATNRTVCIRYDQGPDLYTVAVTEPAEDGQPGTMSKHERIYCDQLGEIVWGEAAKTWTQPIMEVLEWGEDETVEEALARHKVIEPEQD